MGAAMPLAEKKLIARVRRQVKPAAGIVAGIGDDCAIVRVPRGHELLVTTDLSLEGIHFRRDWHPPEAAGHRCLTRGLSDIAAMGGNPIAVFLSMALPKNLPQAWVDGFIRGFLKLARRYRVALAGGDTAESPGGILADVIVVGSAPRGLAIRRSSAKPGDRIYVTGVLGGSAAALLHLRSNRQARLRPSVYPQHFYPEPRLAVGRRLRESTLASSMIDLSDGLSTDLAHICEESGVGAVLLETAIPRASIGKPAREVDLPSALHGGEDYELLFTASPQKRIPTRIAGVPITQVGQITGRGPILLMNQRGVNSELIPHGWEHFHEERK